MDIVTFRTGYTYRITLDDVHEEVGPEYDVWITDNEKVVRGTTKAPFSKKCFGSIYFRRKDKELINKEEAMRLHNAIINLDYASFLDKIEGEGIYEDNGKYVISYHIDSESG